MDIPGYEKYEVKKKEAKSSAAGVIVFMVLLLLVFGLVAVKFLSNNKIQI